MIKITNNTLTWPPINKIVLFNIDGLPVTGSLKVFEKEPYIMLVRSLERVYDFIGVEWIDLNIGDNLGVNK